MCEPDLPLVDEEEGRVQVQSSRPALTQEQFQRRYLYTEPVRRGCSHRTAAWLRDTCRPSRVCLTDALRRRLPLLAWLPAYQLRTDLLGDLIAGVTAGIMHIPQGLAYAVLAGVPPIHGLYMAFFQVLCYMVLGTSRQLSVGTFAVICIMTGKVVSEHAEPDQPGSAAVPLDPVQVASTVTLAVGLVELAMFALHAGALTVLLSDMLVKGFTTGAAVHVLMSQLKSLLGLRLPRFSGPGKLVCLLAAALQRLGEVNPAALLISATAIGLLVLNTLLLKPWLASKTRVPFPIELILVVVGTLVSHFTDLAGSYGVDIVGPIPTGLPAPVSPIFSLLPRILVDAVVISIVSYSVGLSMAQLFAKKHGYTIDAGQELVAHGVTNVVTSFFSCLPLGASLSRSLILEDVGGRTQLSGLITSGLLLVVLLWLAPLVQALPYCVLSSIIVVSLKGMFLQVGEVRQVWRCSRADALIWVATLLAVVLLDIDIGLGVGVAVSLIVLLVRTQTPRTALLGSVRGTGLHLDIARYAAAAEEEDIKIFRFEGAVHFCNVQYFRSEVIRLTCVDPLRWQLPEGAAGAAETCPAGQVSGGTAERGIGDGISDCETNLDAVDGGGDAGRTEGGVLNASFELEPDGPGTGNGTAQARPGPGPGPAVCGSPVPLVLMYPPFAHLVLDLSRVAFVDTASARGLLALVRDYQAIDVRCYLAGCAPSVLKRLQRSSDFPQLLTPAQLYPTVSDAVVHINRVKDKRI